MTLLLCPPNSLSCIDSVSLGRDCVSEKVNLGWPCRLGQSGDTGEDPAFQGAAVLWDLSGTHFKRKEERSLVSGILFPRQWAAFLTLAGLVKHHGRFPLLSSENQGSNLMLPSLNLRPGEAGRVSSLPHGQLSCAPPPSTPPWCWT